MKPLKILVAEDDKAGRRIIEFFLKPYGDCVTVADGEEALSRYLEATKLGKRFDLILLDIGMPKVSGLEVLKAVREEEQVNQLSSDAKVKVVMLTGRQDVDNINSSLLLGASHYLIKPIEEKSLIRELQRLDLIDDGIDSF